MAVLAQYDLIVIGGGSIGLSTAYHAAKRNLKTLVLEQYGYFNDNGSSAGVSRQFRLQYAVQYMAELVVAAQPFWADLQTQTNVTLIGSDGSLWFGDPDIDSREGGIVPAEKVMDALGIAYTKLNAQQIEDAYLFRNLPSNYVGFFQAAGGIINLKAAEQALYFAADNSGLVDFHEYEPVTGIASTLAGGITVSTRLGDYATGKLAITAGAYTNLVTGHLGLAAPIYIWEMASTYFKLTDPQVQYPTWFYYGKQNDFYGFPTVDWSYPGYIRAAPDFPDEIIALPSQRRGAPEPANLALTAQFVAEHMTGVGAKPEFASTCLAPLAQNADQELLLDYVPSSIPNNMQIVCYTAGWAGKFIPILGDMICQMLTSNITSFNYGSYSIPLSNFAMGWLPMSIGSTGRVDLSAAPRRRKIR
jgi:glycine/D-amino acid oxidase-like deaminating enzyme